MKTDAGQLGDEDLCSSENVLKDLGRNFRLNRAHTDTPSAYHRFQ